MSLLGRGRMLYFLVCGWSLDLDLDMITSIWYTHVQNFCCLHWIWRFKEYQYSLCPNSGLGGHWKFLTVVWNYDLDMDKVTGLLYNHFLTYKCLWLYCFWRDKEYSCHLSTGLGYWRFLNCVKKLDIDFDIFTDFDIHIFKNFDV